MISNRYCTGCLKTQPFVANDRGFECPVCHKTLVAGEPPRAAEDRDDRSGNPAVEGPVAVAGG